MVEAFDRDRRIARTRAYTKGVDTRRYPSTCPRAIGATVTGRSSASSKSSAQWSRRPPPPSLRLSCVRGDTPAGLPILSRHHQAAGACGRERRKQPVSGAADRRPVLHVRQIHPQHRPRSQTVRESRGRAGDRPRNIRGGNDYDHEGDRCDAYSSRLDELKRLQARRHGRRLSRAGAAAGRGEKILPTPNGLHCCSTGRSSHRTTKRAQIACAPRGCATVRLGEDVNYPRTTSARKRSSSSLRGAADHHERNAYHREMRPWQNLARLRPRREGLSRGIQAYWDARMPRLFAQRELVHGDGSFARFFRFSTKVNRVILDDLVPTASTPASGAI